MFRSAAMGLLLVGTLAGAQSPWEPVRMTSGVFRLALHLQSEGDKGCPDDRDPLSVFFAQGPGRRQVESAGARVGHRPELWPRCPSVAGTALLHYREGLVATVSTWQTIVEGMESSTCWESLILQVNGKVDAGTHSIVWDGLNDSGKKVGSGVFWAQMRAGSYLSNKKMVILK